MNPSSTITADSNSPDLQPLRPSTASQWDSKMHSTDVSLLFDDDATATPSEAPTPLPTGLPTLVPTSPTVSPTYQNHEFKLFAQDGVSRSHFGSEVVSNGQVIAVSTSSDHLPGKVYLFTQQPPLPGKVSKPEKSSSNHSMSIKPQWVQAAVLESLGATSDGFGASIALSEEFLVIGAPFTDSSRGRV
mmetsp:Transcript_5213/g.7351  ORF Transcript_5213/g.7351 Transcript_5213/m.7351 type:complete len:188 (+) Transcript_5213:669-1232(+)